MFSPLRETGFAEFKGPPLLPHNLIPFLSSNSRPGQGYSECAVELHWGEGELPLGARTVFLGGRCQDPRLQREPVKHKGRDLQTLLRFHSVVNTQIRAGVSTQDLAVGPDACRALWWSGSVRGQRERALCCHRFSAGAASQREPKLARGTPCRETVLVYRVSFICKMNAVSADKCVNLNT